MKLIIIEGTDNTGKNEIIHRLLEKYDVCKVIHCKKPKATDPKEAAFEQENYFIDLAFDNMNDYRNGSTDAVIHNRSAAGEYVYGCLYRHNDETEVSKMILAFEKQIQTKIPADNIYFFVFLADNPEFLVKNDDGLSLSNAKIDKIAEETERFKKIYELSSLKNKHIVYVNNGTDWRSKQDIWNEVETILDK